MSLRKNESLKESFFIFIALLAIALACALSPDSTIYPEQTGVLYP
jgi:hypothetical protein